MAIVLPTQYKYQELALHMNKLVENKDFVSAMDMIGGFYDKEKAYQIEFEDESGIILFRAATLVDQSNVEGAKQADIIQTVFAGFYYGITDYDTKSKDSEVNKTKLLVNDSVEIQLLNYDSGNDEKADSVSTLLKNDYLYFELPQTKLSSINTLDFIDKSGNSYLKIELSLDYSDQFFIELEDFINRYNDGLTDENKSGDLNELSNTFLSISEDYKIGGDYYSTAMNKGSVKATVFIVFYFIGVYVLADCLLGRRYIIKFFIWLYRKITKKKPEQKPTSDVYGTDYYTQLTYILEVPEDCNSIITIKYHNENSELEMVFSKDKNYTVKQRVHAGIYQNAWMDVKGYEAINLPKILDVKGYNMEVRVCIKRIEIKGEMVE